MNRKLLFILFSMFLMQSSLLAQNLSQTRVAVFGGLWPMPSLLSFFTDAKLVYIPKSSISAIKYSIVHSLKPELLNIPYGANENIEELLALDADVYFCHIGDLKLSTLLKNNGKEVISFAVNINDYNLKSALQNWLDTLKSYFDIKEKSQDLIQSISHIENMIEQRTKGTKKIRAMILASFNDKQIIAGGRDYLIKYSGGENVFSNESDNSRDKVVSIEEIYKKDPEIIFITNFTPSMPSDLLNKKEWQGISAIKNKRVYKLPLATYRPYAPNLDIGIVLQFMAQKNYPLIFSDINIEKEFISHFKKYYGISLTHNQIMDILNPNPKAGNTK